MKIKKAKSHHDNPLTEIARQLELVTKLLAMIATDKDFASHTQARQIAILGKIGFRNKELSTLFGIKPQQVNNAFLKYKVKRH